jgi:hypothetical protein
MEGVHVEREAEEFTSGDGKGRVDVVVEFGKAVEKPPHRLVGRVKDVGPIAMNMNAFRLVGVAVPRHMGAALDHQNPLATIRRQACEGAVIQAGSNHKVVVGSW